MKQRLYEWRDQFNQAYGEPFMAPDACAARLMSQKAGKTCEVALGQKGQPGVRLSIFVVATGERVETELHSSGRAARLNADHPWHDVNGKERAP